MSYLFGEQQDEQNSTQDARKQQPTSIADNRKTEAVWLAGANAR